MQRVTTRNAAFQQWEALLTNRTKRHRAGEMVVQGVRPITLAVESGWTVRTWLVDADRSRSSWAPAKLDRVRAPRFAVPVKPPLRRAAGVLKLVKHGRASANRALAVVALPSRAADVLPLAAECLGELLRGAHRLNNHAANRAFDNSARYAVLQSLSIPASGTPRHSATTSPSSAIVARPARAAASNRTESTSSSWTSST